MKKSLLIAVIAIPLIAASCNKTPIPPVSTNQPNATQGIAIGEPNPGDPNNTGKPVEPPVLIEEPEVKDDKPADEKPRLMAIHDGQYVDYSDEAFQTAISRGDKLVLFFYANWCPTCQAADKDFRAHLETDFPKSTTVIRVNYTSGGEMERKYGVTYQHTFVQVDYDRNQITKWIGGNTADLIKNLK